VNPLRLVNLVVGVIMIVYAIIAFALMPGIAAALLILGGLLLIWNGLGKKKLV
jgi:hypothetical protein